MKKIFCMLVCLMSFSAFAQSQLSTAQTFDLVLTPLRESLKKGEFESQREFDKFASFLSSGNRIIKVKQTVDSFGNTAIYLENRECKTQSNKSCGRGAFYVLTKMKDGSIQSMLQNN